MSTTRIGKTQIIGIHAAITRAASELARAGDVPVAQQALQNALAIIGNKADPCLPRGRNGPKKAEDVKRWEHGGKMLTAVELAKLAGCGTAAMRKRLDKMGAADAVAMGPATHARPRGLGASVWGDRGHHPSTKFYELDGERLTVAQLAERAGCPQNTIRSRLLVMTVERAVALGKADHHRLRAAAGTVKKPATAKPKPGGSEALSAQSWSIRAKKKAPKVAAPTGPVVMLPGVKITRAAAPVGRFAVDPRTVPCTFGRIGQYEDSGSALERAYGALSCADSHAGGR